MSYQDHEMELEPAPPDPTDLCPVCGHLECVCPPESADEMKFADRANDSSPPWWGIWWRQKSAEDCRCAAEYDPPLSLDRTEATCDIFDHCRFCGAGGNLWYGLCDNCNAVELAKG